MPGSLRVVHYLNQFFAGIGGEQSAGALVSAREGPVGPGRALQQLLGNDATIVTTVVCGDNYFNEERQQAEQSVRRILDGLKPDLVVAGPAFNAGRYALACAAVCRLAHSLGVPAITGMDPENPAAVSLGPEVVAVRTGSSSTGMRPALERLVPLALKLARGQGLGPARLEGYIARGIRKPAMAAEPGYKRAVDMLAAKLRGDSYRTEILMNPPERVKPAPAISDLSSAVIALVTTGGLVRKGNPEGQVPRDAVRFHSHSIEHMESLSPKEWEAYHAGYFNHVVNSNPNYILPLSYLRELERKGVFRSVYSRIYALPGVSTSVGNSRRMGEEIAHQLRDARVGGCLLVST